MPVIPRPADRSLPSALGLLAWRGLQVAAAVLVVVPLGYATTAAHKPRPAGRGLRRRGRPRAQPAHGPGAAQVEIGDWVSFSFFSALTQNHSGITPASIPARILLGIQLILSVGWALVVFAAVMSSIQPQLERTARRASGSEP